MSNNLANERINLRKEFLAKLSKLLLLLLLLPFTLNIIPLSLSQCRKVQGQHKHTQTNFAPKKLIIIIRVKQLSDKIQF